MKRSAVGIRAIAFDLDGTLIDSAPDIRAALNAALAAEGLPEFDLDSVRGWIGDGPDALIARALARLGGDFDAALPARLRQGFDAATLAAPLGAGGVFDGMHALLDRLRVDLPLVVVSNKPTPLSRAVLAAAGLLPLLHGVHGADRAELRKPAPGLLQLAARTLDIATGELLMVGDSQADLRAADAAGCPAVLVAWGYGSEQARQFPHAARAETAAELDLAIAALARGTPQRIHHS